MLMSWTLGWTLGMCGLGPLVQIIIIIIFIFLYFELVSLYTTVISKTMCLFSNVYMYSLSFMKNNFKKNSLREKIFCAFIWVKERERDRVVRRARTLCAFSPCCRSFYLRRQTSMSLKAPQIVWGVKSVLGKLCQTQDLICIIHPSRILLVSF